MCIPHIFTPIELSIKDWLKRDYSNRTDALAILNAGITEPPLNLWVNQFVVTGHNRSKKLWQWRQARRLADHNLSPEKILEKKAVELLNGDTWANQVNTAAGLSLNTGDRKRSIDLINMVAPGHYRFIELKIESNNPVYAAVELLEYALLYWWLRCRPDILKPDADRDNKALMKARHVVFEVLAPGNFYSGYSPTDLRKFANVLTRAFQKLSEDKMEIEFVFTQFTDALPAAWSKTSIVKALEHPKKV